MRFNVCFIALVLFVLSVGFASAQDPGAINHDVNIIANSSLEDSVVLPSDSSNADLSNADSNNVDVSLSGSNNTGISQSDDDYGSWYDLCRDIQNLKQGDVYNFEHDYVKPDNEYLPGIGIIADNVTINGNGHIIKGSEKSINLISDDADNYNKGNILTVAGNNVKIDNLIISNSGKELILNKMIDVQGTNNDYTIINFSPICWIGNNGICSNCIFRDNKAFNGGSISWLGENGLINNTQFINSSATRVGSAIYLGGNPGNKLTIENMTAKNLQSGWMGNEPIYVDGLFDVFHPSYYVNVFDTQVDLTKCLFDYLVYGGMRSVDNLTFYGEILNDGEFSLNFAKEIYDNNMKFILNEELSFLKHFQGDKMIKYSNVTLSEFEDNFFNALKRMSFKINFSYNAFYNATDIKSYNKAINLNTGVFKDYKKYLNTNTKYAENSGTYQRTGHSSFTTALHVDILNSFTDAKTWNPKKMGFDIIYIDGHNNTINGNAKNRQEYKFVQLTKGTYSFIVEHLTIKKFNNAIANDGGYAIFNDVTFKDNKVKYVFDKDWGAAIKNAGMTICNNCTFSGNEASKGGAIFNQGLLTLNDCNFSGNHAKDGANVLNVDKGIVTIDGVQIKGSSGDVEYKKSISSACQKILKYGAIGLSFVGGLAVGIITCNPVVGAAAGAGIGLALGSIASTVIAKNVYDINFNVAKSTAIIMGCSVGAGILGGITGGFIGSAFQGSASAGSASSSMVEDKVVMSDKVAVFSDTVSESNFYDPSEWVPYGQEGVPSFYI